MMLCVFRSKVFSHCNFEWKSLFLAFWKLVSINCWKFILQIQKTSKLASNYIIRAEISFILLHMKIIASETIQNFRTFFFCFCFFATLGLNNCSPRPAFVYIIDASEWIGIALLNTVSSIYVTRIDTLQTMVARNSHRFYQMLCI